ncbi:hypothetical protein SESBI_38511 [Sesbania bispinosa]|nr:hypothetical protein SESBI_38511 [Sesbania bispinosa]
MPPRQRAYHEIEMEELRCQLQQLQATVEIQQTQIEEQRRRLEGESDESDSPYADNLYSRKQQFRSSDINVEIPDFEDCPNLKIVTIIEEEVHEASEEDEESVFDEKEPIYDEEFTSADHDGAKIKLAPMSPSEFNQSKKETKPLVSLVAKEQFKVTKEEAQAMSHILLLESTEGTILPPEIEQLLAKYPDVIPEEIRPQRDKHRRLQTFKVGDLKINDNTYKVELLGSYRVYATFNVADLSPYFDDEAELDWMTSPIQPGEGDTTI